MSLPRFFVDPQDVETGVCGEARGVRIAGEEAQHLARVLRLEPGQRAVVCDGLGMEYLVVINSVSPQESRGEVIAQRRGVADAKAAVQLFMGLPKGDKMDYLVQKCTELGVAAIHPVITERSVVRLNSAKAISRSRRWERIAKEAAKQSGRAQWPPVSVPLPLVEAAAHFPCRHLLVAWERASIPLRQTLIQLKESDQALGKGLGVVIGPEGGLSEAEVAALERLGGMPVSLGPRILRCETAGMVMVALVLDALGELDEAATANDW